MKAAIVKEAGKLVVEDLPEPELGPYDVLTDQLFGGVCAATDQHLIAGELPIPGIAYPLILGHESIGRVIETGPKVRNLKVGDLVTRTGAPAIGGCQPFWGGFAERGIAKDVAAMKEDGLPEDEWSAHEINLTLPADFDPAAATMMITWRETHSYLSRLGIAPDDRVLILGSGGNGFSFAVLAKALGAGMVAMLGNPHWAAHASRAGVDAFADYRDAEGMDTLGAASPDGYDVIIDSVGHTGGLETALPLLKENGAVGLYGIEDLGERIAFLEKLTADGVRVHGPGEYKEAEAHDAVVKLVKDGKLDASIWFDPAAPTPLLQISDAIDAIRAKRSLKAVVDLTVA